MAKQLAKTRHNPALKEDKNSFITTFVSNVGESPADVIEDLGLISLAQHLGKRWDGSIHLGEVGTGLPLAEV